MIQFKPLKISAQTTIAAVSGALASVFFNNWINNFPLWLNLILIPLYTLLIFVILYFFFKE